MKSELSPLVASDSTSDADVLHVVSRDHIITSSNTSYWADALDTVQLGVPLFVARLSWVGMKTTDSALLGHVSAEALAAAALSDLYAMSTLVLVQGRILSVFVGQAVGANNPRLAGVYLQVSLHKCGRLWDKVPKSQKWQVIMREYSHRVSLHKCSLFSYLNSFRHKESCTPKSQHHYLQ